MTPITPPFWAGPAWAGEVQEWIDAALARQGRSLAGPLEQIHRQPWSTVLRAPTADGLVFFKAVSPDIHHEVAITAALARWHADLVLQPLAADSARGWMLLPDGGARLRERIRADRDLGHWHALLPHYAELQIDLAARQDELLALGAADWRLAHFPRLYAELLNEHDQLWLDQPDGLPSADHARLLALAPHVSAWCAELAASGIPESLNHGDLHDGNIFFHNGNVRIFDWGDGSVSHPFFSLRTTFVSIENSLGLEENAPEFVGVADAYLAPWARDMGMERLRAVFALALRLAPLCGAFSWAGTVRSLTPALRADYNIQVPSLLQEFLANVDRVAT